MGSCLGENRANLSANAAEFAPNPIQEFALEPDNKVATGPPFPLLNGSPER